VRGELASDISKEEAAIYIYELVMPQLLLCADDLLCEEDVARERERLPPHAAMLMVYIYI
jgi:hypothetical protein